MSSQDIKYRPNASDYNPNTHEVIEAYLKSRWNNTTDDPKQDEINFSFTLEDKNPEKPGIDFAIKCYPNGFQDLPHTANYQTIRRMDKVKIHLEGRMVMNNRQKDIPVTLLAMKDKIVGCITGDSTALQATQGIYQMYVTGGEEIEEVYKKDARNIFRLDMYCECHYLLGRIIIP